MLWGIDFQVLTSRNKKDCCSFVLFINGIVNMREVEQRIGREYLTLDFVKYWFSLHGCCLWYKLYIILPTEVESRTQGSRPRPRTQKKSEVKAKDSLFEDRPS